MKTLIVAVVMIVAVLSDAHAQGRQGAPPTPPKPPAPPAAPAAPMEAAAPAAAAKPVQGPGPGELVNIRVDVTFTEDGGPDALLRKAVSITTSDRRNGMVRSQALTVSQNRAEGQIAVDTRPWIERDGRIRTLVTVSYVSHPHFSNVGQLKFEPLLESGKPLVVSQAPSAVSDRRVTVEVTATILK